MPRKKDAPKPEPPAPKLRGTPGHKTPVAPQLTRDATWIRSVDNRLGLCGKIARDGKLRPLERLHAIRLAGEILKDEKADKFEILQLAFGTQVRLLIEQHGQELEAAIEVCSQALIQVEPKARERIIQTTRTMLSLLPSPNSGS